MRHPYNPDNNVNYTSEQSGLPTGEWTTDPGHPLSATVPRLRNNRLVLRYQKAFIDKVLSCMLQYGHVLYSMNNETKEHRRVLGRLHCCQGAGGGQEQDKRGKIAVQYFLPQVIRSEESGEEGTQYLMPFLIQDGPASVSPIVREETGLHWISRE